MGPVRVAGPEREKKRKQGSQNEVWGPVPGLLLCPLPGRLAS